MHQNVSKLKSRAVKFICRQAIVPFFRIIISFFPFLCQDANISRSNCAIIGCNSSKKLKLTPKIRTERGPS